MARDIETVREVAEMNSDEKGFLQSPRRPIVLLKKKSELDGVSPFLDNYGQALAAGYFHRNDLDGFDARRIKDVCKLLNVGLSIVQFRASHQDGLAIQEVRWKLG
jgi:hypothetical protein